VAARRGQAGKVGTYRRSSRRRSTQSADAVALHCVTHRLHVFAPRYLPEFCRQHIRYIEMLAYSNRLILQGVQIKKTDASDLFHAYPRDHYHMLPKVVRTE